MIASPSLFYLSLAKYCLIKMIFLSQANENFTMVLTSIDGTVLGRKTSIIITILQNDDANGVFSFANASMNLIKYAGIYVMFPCVIVGL